MIKLREANPKGVDKRVNVKYYKYKYTTRLFTGTLNLVEENGKIYDSMVSSVTELEEVGFIPQCMIRFSIIGAERGGILVEDVDDKGFTYLFSMSGFLNGLTDNILRKERYSRGIFISNVRIKKRCKTYFVESYNEEIENMIKRRRVIRKKKYKIMKHKSKDKGNQ